MNETSIEWSISTRDVIMMSIISNRFDYDWLGWEMSLQSRIKGLFEDDDSMERSQEMSHKNIVIYVLFVSSASIQQRR